MRKITVLLKPTEECNFRCRYCYHADTQYENGRMSIGLFEEVIRKTFSCYNDIVLIFHGGEPLLMGYGFFDEAMKIINNYKRSGLQLKMGIQTNGYYLNNDYCELFEKNGILPAVSFDGPGALNGLRCKTDEIVSKIIQLRERGYKINLLGVITKQNINNLWEYYEFAKNNGCHIKLNPVFKSGAAKDNSCYLIDAKEYICVLKQLLPQWMEDVSAIKGFDPLASLIYMALTNVGIGCTHCGCLSKWISVHHDGLLYPCGRSYSKEYCFGNIQDIDELTQAFEHKNFRRLLQGAIERRINCRNKCEYYDFCQGGCNNDAILNGDLTRPNDFVCEVYREMVPYIREYVKSHRDTIRNQQVTELLNKMHYG